MPQFTFVELPDGSKTPVEVPTGPGDGRARIDPRAEAKRQEDAKKARSVADGIKKRVLKIRDYLEYLEYLRSVNPMGFSKVMAELQKTDPKLWLALQKYPQFRPVSKMVGWQAGARNAVLAVDLANGNRFGGLEKWLEGTVKDCMKRDNWGPFAKGKGSTLPELPKPTFSNSRLGQFLSEEVPRMAKAAKQSEAQMASARAATRAELSGSMSRVGGAVLNVEFAALDPTTHNGISQFYLTQKLERAYEAGKLADEDYVTARTLLSQGKLAELQKFLESLKVTQ